MTAGLQELEGQLQALKEAWALRRDCCEENWSLQKLRQGLDQAEAWLASREGLLQDPNCGVSQGLALSPAAPTIDRPAATAEGNFCGSSSQLATQAGCRG